MVFFFALTWFLVVRKSNWKYLVACALVLSKTPASLLLIPIVLKDKNWKLLLPILTLIPWYIWGAVANHNFLWLFNHWSGLNQFAQSHLQDVFSSKNRWPILLSQNIFPYLVITLPIFILVKKYYAEVSLFFVALALFYGWACIIYQATPLVVCLPLIMAPWVDRVNFSKSRILGIVRD
jgi:hypothetical protein